MGLLPHAFLLTMLAASLTVFAGPRVVTDRTLLDFGSNFEPELRSRTVLFRNAGDAPLTLDWAYPDYRTADSTCPAALAPGATCTMSMKGGAGPRFEPWMPTIGPQILLKTNDPQRPQVTISSGGQWWGLAPRAALVSFDVVQVMAPDEVRHVMRGRMISQLDEPFEVFAVSTPSDERSGLGKVEFSGCIGVLAARGSCDFEVTVAPNAVGFRHVRIPFSSSRTLDDLEFTVVRFNAPGDADNDGMPDVLEAPQGLDVGARDNDVFSNATLFVKQVHRDFLGEEASDNQARWWAERIDRGEITRIGLATSYLQALVEAPEFLDLTNLHLLFQVALPDFIVARRTPTEGVDLVSRARTLQANAALSRPWFALVPQQDATVLVNYLYGNGLLRPADEGGRRFWVTALATGRLTSAEVIAAFVTSPEMRATSLRPWYWAATSALLPGRAIPFDSPINARGLDPASLVAAILASPEYRARFLP